MNNPASSNDGASRKLGDPQLVGLLIVWASLLFGGMVLGTLEESGAYRTPKWARLYSSYVLVVAGWIWWYVATKPVTRRYAVFIATGMTFGFLGDLFNAKVLWFPIDPLMGGIAAFGIGHVAYIWGMVELGERLQLGRPWALTLAVVGWQILGVVSWIGVVYLGVSQTNVIVWASLPYSLLLAGTAGVASGLAIRNWRFTPLALGGLLFLVSDMIIAIGQFREPFPRIGDWIWATYGPAQALIVYSIGSANTLAGRAVQPRE